MIRALIDMLKYAKQYSGTLSEKIRVLITLMSLAFRHKLNKNPSEPVSAKFFGNTMHGYDYATLDFLFKEVFLAKDYAFSSTKSNPKIIDCGSNIGMSIAFFKTNYPEAEIVGFEANPDAFALLQSNINTNGFNNTVLHNVALSDHDGHLSFFVSGYKGTLTGSVFSSRGGEKEIQVKAVKLSDYLVKFDHVDLLKMDVEGAEFPIVKELFESDQLKKVDQLIIEYHHNMPNVSTSMAEFLALFESAGFSYNIRTNFFTLRDFQNVLIHFYR